MRRDLTPSPSPVTRGEQDSHSQFPPLPLGEGGWGGEVALLAPRLRVEERQLIAAFGTRGYEAKLLKLDDVAVSLGGDYQGLPELVIDRGVATTDRALFAALVAPGSLVVNRTATTRLLADRLAFARHMLIAGLPVPETAVGFGEASTLRALQQIGYPAALVGVHVDTALPDATIHDEDAAEAIVEHRSMLGHETMVLVQRLVSGRHLRVAVVGAEIIGAETLEAGQRGTTRYEQVTSLAPAVERIAGRVISRLGSGVYEIRFTEGDGGPVVTGAGNLVDFRSLNEAGVDVAGKIADFALAQHRSNQRELVAQHG